MNYLFDISEPTSSSSRPNIPLLHPSSHSTSQLPGPSAYKYIHSLLISQDGAQVRCISRAGGRLHAEDVITPPGTGRPPEGSLPDVRVGVHVRQHALDGSLADVVVAAGVLA